MPLGIYHKGCTDGTTAAAVLLRKFPDAKVYPLRHNFPPSDLAPILKELSRDSQVYILDCALGVDEILARGLPVTVLDHHISMKEELEQKAQQNPLLTYIFDNEKSGASLAWGYFFPDHPVPRVIELVEDHDLWKEKYGQETKTISAYLILLTDKPHEVLPLLEGISQEVYQGGALLSQYTDLLVREVSEFKPVHLKIGEHSVRGYNATTSQSEIGSALSAKIGATVCLFAIQGDHVRLSFRSKEKQSPSALDLASLLGGGGHVLSAGARVSLRAFVSMLSAEDLKSS